MKQIMKII